MNNVKSVIKKYDAVISSARSAIADADAKNSVIFYQRLRRDMRWELSYILGKYSWLTITENAPIKTPKVCDLKHFQDDLKRFQKMMKESKIIDYETYENEMYEYWKYYDGSDMDFDYEEAWLDDKYTKDHDSSCANRDNQAQNRLC